VHEKKLFVCPNLEAKLSSIKTLTNKPNHMKKLSSHWLLIVFCSILFPSFIQAQGTIEGSVKDNTGEAVSFSIIRIKDSNFGAIADDQGMFKITNVPAGSYSVKASSVGFDDAELMATVTNGGTVKLDFILSSSQTLKEVVVTGVVNPKSSLESSISISTLNARQVDELGARSTAEVLRSIPGIRSEASAGEGNTNITVRGVPIATGGSKYLQFHEDGLPVLQFGDIAFATADIFTRFDYSVGRIEALRGGSASTLASNSPAGVINFISKTGAVEGGSVATTAGIDFRSYRTDFEYGTPMANNMSFHIGGFFRQGDGPRATGYNASYGGQIKANFTKYFNRGYARVYLKYLNDRTPAYMPMPIEVSGTNENPQWGSVTGYSALRGTLHTPALIANLSTGPDGQIRRSSLADGMHANTTAIGTEFAFEVGEGWKLTNRARMAFNNGVFVAPFTAAVGPAADIANSVAPGYTALTYAAGGGAFPSDANGNGLLMRMHLFDTQLNNFNNFTNDFNVQKDLGRAKINAGVYKAYQAISMSWLWNSYLMEVSDDNAQLVNVSRNDTMFTDNGLIAYGVPAWGNCCHRNYDTYYDIFAPYAGVEVNVNEAITVDASVRFDSGNVTGSFAGGDGQTKPYDMNGDGSISQVEQNVATIDNASARPVNYSYSYLSYSAGLNYLLSDKMSVFARYSVGGRANADRLLFGPYINPDGSAAAGLSSDMVSQGEFGYKFRKENVMLNATAFYAMTEEQNFEATTQQSVNREYTALGMELDGQYSIKGFNIRGGLTFTDAEISADVLNPDVVGNRPRRQAALIYNFSPSYTYKNHTLGVSAIGTTESYAQDNNELIMPGYTYLNLFVNLQVAKGFNLMINGNNILDAIGITESEEGSIVDNTTQVLRARSITGRTFSATLRYSF
jgi:outer membrane receptor protein involved in Fe transport